MSLFFLFGFAVVIDSGSKNLYLTFSLSIFGILFLLSGVKLLKNSQKAYLFSITTLTLEFIITAAYRFFLVTNHKLQIIDLNNLLLFGIPLILIIAISNKSEYR